MHIHVVDPCQPTLAGEAGLIESLIDLGHLVTSDVLGRLSVPDAAELGHALADRWSSGSAPDVVLAADWLAGLTAQIATRDLGLPVVQRLYAPGRTTDPEQRRLQGAVGRGARRVLGACSADLDLLVDRGLRRGSLRVVPHGVDTQIFTDSGPVWPRGELPRIVARPGADEAAIRRLAALLPFLPSCEVVLLTTGQTRVPVTTTLSALPGQAPGGQRVRLLDVGEPRLGAAGLAALLRSSDLVIVTGDDQVELDLALRGMATGLPVVGPAVGAMADVVADGVTGVLVASAAAAPLADAARTLLADSLRLETYGLSAGDRARASFAWPAVTGTLSRVLDEVVSSDQADVPADAGAEGTGLAVKSGPPRADAPL